ncbi:tetratricopeptide repeat protein [Duganella sp. LX20W]|uniref:Tetratricopeptide repeat protein n=1 Tax=Rugamonas brunnea TaxID=2758569 RepID=A0A7W2IAD8_9BURK|nr:CheR family methyltransferase [Rugamonas brunnea]MBA5636149.1 tetratricopeptide repeat protein [Rugamonas brunnea]
MNVQTILRQATGLNLSKSVAERAMASRMERLGVAEREAYLAALSPDELTQLVELVVVPESWLFRDPVAFQAAVVHVKARLSDAQSGTIARILSVPCAGGEEPYSMAMALSDAGVDPERYTIDAWDISPVCVARAQAGVYGRNAFRSDDLRFRERHFTRTGDEEYTISDALRGKVRFRQGSLFALDAGRLPKYDVIFCRNLLIYFDKPTTRDAAVRLSALLADDGLLFAGYAEVPAFCQHGFAPLQFPRAFGLKKEGAAPPPSAPGKAPVPAPGMPSAAMPRTQAPQAHSAAKASVPSATKQSGAARATGAAPATKTATTRAYAQGAPAAATPPTASTATATLLEQARKLADQGRFAEAENACQTCLAQTPDAADAYFILGLLNEQAGQLEKAEQHWRRCIYLRPDHYEALCHLALLAEHNRDPGAAALKARAARVYQRQQAS